jgi:RNA polymerase sigma factor (sigma-70 family)
MAAGGTISRQQTMVVTDGDATLVQRARAGDKEAFACLLTRHLPLMRRVCRRLLGADDGLEDVVQEAALQALLGLDRLRDPAQFGPWLTGIALNVARRSRRRQAQYPWSCEALTGGGLVREPIADSPGPDQLAEASELAQSVRRAVADLPAGQRAAVLLVYLAGLTHRETASLLGIDPGAVKTRLHKGRRSLRQRLRDLWMENLMTTSVEQQLIEMKVEDVRRRPNAETDTPAGGRSVVVLREAGGERWMPIWVGNWEADSIAMLLEKLKVPRPLTHAFTASLLRAGGVRVVEVRIHRLAEETFYAQVVLQGAQGEQAVDARPSDSIALALELSIPIYVASEVLTTVENARANCDPDQPPPTIGAAQIVDDLVEHWPHEPKPVR